MPSAAEPAQRTSNTIPDAALRDLVLNALDEVTKPEGTDPRREGAHWNFAGEPAPFLRNVLASFVATGTVGAPRDRL